MKNFKSLKAVDGRFFTKGDKMYYIDSRKPDGVGEIIYDEDITYTPNTYFYDKATAIMFVVGYAAVENFLNPDYSNICDEDNAIWVHLHSQSVINCNYIADMILSDAKTKVAGIRVFDKYRHLHNNFKDIK